MNDKKTPREAFENAVANILHRWDREDDYGVEHVVADIHAALASGQQAPEPVAWEVYVAEQQNGYIVDDLEDPQLVDDLTNHNAELTPLYRAPPQASEPAAEVVLSSSGRLLLMKDGQIVAFPTGTKLYTTPKAQGADHVE